MLHCISQTDHVECTRILNRKSSPSMSPSAFVNRKRQYHPFLGNIGSVSGVGELLAAFGAPPCNYESDYP